MAGDLKTLKCMLGCKLGANTMHPCIYCSHTKVDPNAKLKGSTKAGIAKGKVCKGTVGKGKKPQVTMDSSTNKKSMQWFQGIMSCDQTTPLNCD